MPRKQFAGAAATCHLNSSLSAIATSFTVSETATGWPTGTNPFVVTVDRGTTSEEKILCSARSSSTFTVATNGRGYDGTAATTHTNGATIDHTLDSITVDEANAHVNDTTRDDHSQYLNVARHDVTARHTFGAALGTPAAAVSSAPGDASSSGSAGVPARQDHRHGREGWGLTGDITGLGIAVAAAAGATGKVADAGHAHAGPGDGGTTAAVGSAAATGSASSMSRSDHVHVAPQHVRLLGRTSTSATGGSPPAAGTGPWLMQAGYTTVTAGATNIVGFPSAWPNGCIAVIPVPPADCFIDVEGVSTTTFTVKISAADAGGHIIGATGSVSFGWIAVGW